MNTGSLWDNYQMIQQSVVNTMDPEELYRYKKMSELLIKKTMEEPDDPHVAKMESATQVRLMLRDGLDPDDLEEDEREIYVDVYGLKSLENYKKKIEKFLNIKITIYGFDNFEGLPEPESYKDLPFIWKKRLFTVDKNLLEKKIDSQIIYGDIANTLDEFVTLSPKNISAIFFDLDYYSSTKSFLKQIKKLQYFLCPRVYCYFDNVFDINYGISEFNGELLTIKEFNEENNEIKIANNLDNINDFKFPLAKNMLWVMHNFGHQDYNKFIGPNDMNSLSLGNTNVDGKIF